MNTTPQTATVQIKRLPHAQDLPLPAYQSAQAAGLDLQAAITDEITIAPGQTQLIPTGFAIALPAGYEAQIRPRSGLAVKHGISIPNAPGTIDADYRGELKVALINLSQNAFTITPAMRIAQMVIAQYTHATFQLSENLDETARGQGGFGHTGQ